MLFVLLLLLKVAAAYALLDLFTGLYHYATDKGYNTKEQVALFQEHHDTNSMEGPGFYLTIGPGIVLLVLAWYFGSVFLLALGVFTILAQVPHYFAHVPNPPKIVVWLQEAGLMIHPDHHAGHHNGTFDQNYCILTGWNDIWLNKVIKYFEKK